MRTLWNWIVGLLTTARESIKELLECIEEAQFCPKCGNLLPQHPHPDMSSLYDLHLPTLQCLVCERNSDLEG